MRCQKFNIFTVASNNLHIYQVLKINYENSLFDKLNINGLIKHRTKIQKEKMRGI